MNKTAKTLVFDPELYKAAQMAAIDEDRSISNYVSVAIKDRLQKNK